MSIFRESPFNNSYTTNTTVEPFQGTTTRGSGLIKELKTHSKIAIYETENFLKKYDIDLTDIIETEDVFQRTKKKDDAVESILITEDSKKEYLNLADKVQKLFKLFLPDPIEEKYRLKVYMINRIAGQIQSLTPQHDISKVMEKVEQLLDDSIEGYKVVEPIEEYKAKLYDLSQIDFDKLKERFEKGRRRIQIEELKTLIEKKLHEMIAVNQARMDFLEKYKEMITEYNESSKTVEETFQRLLDFFKELNEEEQRHFREELDEDELAVFDILTRPELNLTKKEEKEVKGIARQLLKTLKEEKLVLDWCKKQQTRAAVKLAIAEILDKLPALFDKLLYDQKCQLVYNYVYERY